MEKPHLVEKGEERGSGHGALLSLSHDLIPGKAVFGASYTVTMTPRPAGTPTPHMPISRPMWEPNPLHSLHTDLAPASQYIMTSDSALPLSAVVSRWRSSVSVPLDLSRDLGPHAQSSA
ncbi:unnamed protein product [Lota lota]